MSLDISGWPVPNYTNPETRGPVGRIVQITLISVATVLLGLRLYTREFISKNFGLDDVLIVISYIPAIAYSAIGIYGEIVFTWNRHTWDIDPRLFTPSLKASMAEVILFDLTASFTKLSLLATVYRMTSCSKDRVMSMAVRIMATIISVNAATFFFITIFQCTPINSYWSLSLHKNCINEGAHVFAAGIINTVTDFITVFLPMKLVLGLGLPRRQQYIAIGLFGAGLLASVAGVFRTVYTAMMFTNDRIWYAWAVQLSSSIELFIGIICACIPAIKLLFETYLPKVIDATTRSGRSALQYHGTSAVDRNRRKSSSFGFGRGSMKSVVNRRPTSATQLVRPMPPFEANNMSMASPLASPPILSPPVIATSQRAPPNAHTGSFSLPLASHPVNLNKALPPIRETHRFYLQLNQPLPQPQLQKQQQQAPPRPAQSPYSRPDQPSPAAPSNRMSEMDKDECQQSLERYGQAL